MPKINDEKLLIKINEVREAYNKLRKNEIDTAQFYEISGIKLSVNEPLIIEE